MKTYWELSAAMARTGILGYGGGPSTVPLIRYEAVIRYGWVTDEEFGDVLAIANALPGPIATKLAAYLGYRLKKGPGALMGILAHILPSSIAMIALYAFINFFSTSPIIKGMIAAVVPVVAIMLAQMCYEFGEKAVKGLGIYAALSFILVSFVLLQLVNVHPAIVIIIALAYGSIHFRLVARLKGTRAKKGDE
ncbi:chromate transporter [Paenibacillus shirakamiensis]|uniref:Chromate transporter n=1 Tax=Paenibacillus shirakamiensis TaxID=1265935 RepID=A0ABS4JDX9_9BACL|nr:chromate transporter [Paenibacillus shirakamiensis]MBP1999890.1 chromate transporter [Paenibacillus shirakamiensis]